VVSTILFVDDHHAFRTVFAEILRSAGHVVLEAGTMADTEQLVRLQSGAIDLLIVEAVLTTTNGLEIARSLQPTHPEIRVLFISEQAAESLLEERLLPKGAPFLRKPFGAEDLIAKLQQVAKARKPAQAGAGTTHARARRRLRTAH
jgi:two-component system cell cycle sensor histidine kinase/response regulator CckA